MSNLRLVLLLLALFSLPCAAQEAPPPEKKAPKASPKASATDVEDALFRARVALVEQLLDGDLDARGWRRLGDWHKGRRRYPEAAIHYLIALRTNPKLRYAAYQLACTFSLWGQKDLALKWLERAVELGFWGYPVLEDDDDLSALRGDSRFKACLAKVRAAYPLEAKKNPGQRVVSWPKGLKKPAEGWPVLVFLHGWGDNALSYRSLAKKASELGLVGVALPGPVALMQGSFRWSKTGYASTHSYVQKHLAGLAEKGLDTKRVYLLGFSQGAHHAAGLCAGYPEHYRGALVLSPGGEAPLPTKLLKPERLRRIVLTLGETEDSANKEEAAKLEALWTAAKWPLTKIVHKGGHAFPKDFDERFAKLVAWVRGG
jgi:predicted esterase